MAKAREVALVALELGGVLRLVRPPLALLPYGALLGPAGFKRFQPVWDLWVGLLGGGQRLVVGVGGGLAHTSWGVTPLSLGSGWRFCRGLGRPLLGRFLCPALDSDDVSEGKHRT